MIFQPRIFTFYSYKGGVGRSMALLNLAYYLQARGRHVLMVDMDLEAPGVSGYLSRNEELEPATAKGDVVDLLTQVTASARSGAEVPALPDADLGNYLRSVRPDKYATAIHPRAPRARLDVLAADEARDYTARLSALDLATCSADQIALASEIFRALLLRHRFLFQQPWQADGERPEPTAYDYILVDSRTGLTEIGGFCVGPLADRLIVLCGLNDQNVVGTQRFLELVGIHSQSGTSQGELWDEADPPAKDSARPATLGPKPTLLVASPVPSGELHYKAQRLEALEKTIGLRPLKLSYHPQMALMETVFIRAHPDEYLSLEYGTVAQQVMAMVGDTASQWTATIVEASRELHSKESKTTSPLDLAQRHARVALSEGGLSRFRLPLSLFKETAASQGIPDQVRWVSIHLAGSPKEEAEAWLDWADSLDTKDNQKSGDPAAFQSMDDKYRKATTLNSNDSRFFHNWGVALGKWAKQIQGEEAEQLFQQATEKYEQGSALDPKNTRLLRKWGADLAYWANRKQGEERERLFLQAEEKFTQALAIKADDSATLFNIACLAGLRGQVAETVQALQRWKAVKPEALRVELDSDSDFDLVRDSAEFQAFRNSLVF